MEVIEKRFSKFQLLSMIVPLFSLIIGLVFIGLADYVSSEIIGKVLSGIIVINGLVSLVKYFYDGFANKIYKFEIVNGLAMLVLGVFVFLEKADNIYNVLGIYFGIFCILSGLMKSFYTYKFLRENESIFGLYLIITLLFIIMGVLSIFNPFAKFMEVTYMVSIFLVVTAVFDLMAASLFRKRRKNILKIFE